MDITTGKAAIEILSVWLNQNYAGFLPNFMEENTADEIEFEIMENQIMRG
jgi:hypothetical protein